MSRDTRAFVFDLDGVIRYWDPEIVAAAESSCGLPAGSIFGTAFESTLLVRAITGKISDYRWREEVTARLAVAHPEANCEAAVAAWSEPHGELISGALEAVTLARAHGPACLLTNATDRLSDDLLKLGLHDSFDFIFNSSEIGSSKPDSLVFEHVDERLGLPASVLFLDDSVANVEAAGRHGWDVLLVRPGDDLIRMVADRVSQTHQRRVD